MHNNQIIETEIFKKAKINLATLIPYGFTKNGNTYYYTKNIMHDTFKVIIEVTNTSLTGKIYDNAFNEEYTNFRLETKLGSYSSKVKEEYIHILKDIKTKCYNEEYFLFKQTNRLSKLIIEKYHDYPDFKWDNNPHCAVFQNQETRKWYALIMNISKNRLDKKSSQEIEILNLKLPPNMITELLTRPAFYPAYHMNKKYWITIVLDDTVPDLEIMDLLAISYSFTIKK